MNSTAHTRKEDYPAMPAGLRALWGEARDWVVWLVGMFNRDALRTRGVNRKQGAQIGIWLMNIEGAVRRLILAAALSFTPLAARKSPACAAAARVPASSSRRPGFCVFRLAPSGGAPPAIPSQLSQPACPAAPKTYGHIPFAADPLLSLGVATQAPRATPLSTRGTHARNPLDRWMRPTRHDPDWRPPQPSATQMFGAPQQLRASTPPPISPRRSRARQPHDPNALPESLADWRRRYDEWERLIPAPDLAARFDALAHIIAHPQAAIARAARRLRPTREAVLPLARHAGAIPAPPRHAAHIPTAGHTQTFYKRCHDKLASPDTS